MNIVYRYILLSVLFLCNPFWGSNHNISIKFPFIPITQSQVQSALNNPHVLGVFGAPRTLEENLILTVVTTQEKANNNQITIKGIQDQIDSMGSLQDLNNDYLNKKNDVQDKKIIRLEQRCFVLEALSQDTALSIGDQADLRKENKKLKRYIDQLEKKITLKNRLYPSQKTTNTLRGIISSSQKNRKTDANAPKRKQLSKKSSSRKNYLKK